MKLQDLIKDHRTSLERGEHVDGEAYGRLVRHLSHFRFWTTERSRSRKLWSHQVPAISLAAAYLSADRRLPIEGIANEAALIKMATGTGKSAVISVICRALPTIRRALLLTPREALTDQLYRYVRRDFWSTMGFDIGQGAAAFHDDGSRTGAAVPEAYTAKLLPSSVGSILHAAGAHQRLVLVGTLQALDQIRRTATKRSNDRAENAAVTQALQMLDLIRSFDLVVVDEGHYEPAISWSRAIRDADLPTILFSATPYRNDYKSFRVRGRFVFNQPIQEALAEKVIRRPIFKSLDRPTAFKEDRQPEVVEVKPAGSESEDTERVSPLSARDKADAAQFVQSLVHAVAVLPNFPGVDQPKIIVRANDNAKLELLQGEINRVAGERALLIHHAQQRNDDNQLRYNSVKAAYRREENRAVRYWLHQTKLLEGVDTRRLLPWPSMMSSAMRDSSCSKLGACFDPPIRVAGPPSRPLSWPIPTVLRGWKRRGTTIWNSNPTAPPTRDTSSRTKQRSRTACSATCLRSSMWKVNSDRDSCGTAD
jgi:Type III restriction enzyme, res subunit